MTTILSNPIKVTIATIISFLIGVISFTLIYQKHLQQQLSLIICLILLLGALFTLPIILKNDQSYQQVSKYTLQTFLFGVIDAYCLQNISLFSVYLIVMSIYFYGQFQLVNCFHHQTLCWNAFLIYHSKHYTLANCAMIIQHVVTKYIFHFEYKEYHIFVTPAFVIMIIGLSMRIIAFFTAQNNFTHIIRTQKKQEHQLVTHGIYSFFRHPSYTGFFYFSIASMLFIGNFVCTIAFAISLQFFFKDRIEYQQYFLLKFFGRKYQQYQKKTYIFIPFVKGFFDNNHYQ